MATMSEAATEAATETVHVAAVTKMAVEVVVTISAITRTAVTRTASKVAKRNASDNADEATVGRPVIPTSGNGHDAQAE